MAPLLYAGYAIEQVDVFKYLAVQMHGTKSLTPAMEDLCKAAKKAMFELQRRCQQLRIHDPTLKCKLFDTLVKPILLWMQNQECPGVQVSDCRSERVQFGFRKILLGVQIHTSTLHVLAEFGRYWWSNVPLEIAWQAQAATYLTRLESMNDNKTLKQAFAADRRLPKQKSWSFQLEAQLRDVSMNVPTVVSRRPQPSLFLNTTLIMQLQFLLDAEATIDLAQSNCGSSLFQGCLPMWSCEVEASLTMTSI